MLVRGAGRVKEIAVRLAIGATRPRIIGQLLSESLSLSALGGLAGLAVAFCADKTLMKSYLPSDSERMKVFYPQLSEALSSIPGVQSVGLASMRILEDNEWDSGMSVQGFTPAKPDEHAQPYMNQIGPNYFATLGVAIVAGRDFTIKDNQKVKHGPESWNWAPTTILINEKLSKKYFAGRNPIFLHIGIGTHPG